MCIRDSGYTQWNKEIKFKTKEFSVKSSEVGKNGWRYEKYAGKVYKFYYKNGEKLTDLTNVRKVKKGNKKLKIVVNLSLIHILQKQHEMLLL